MSKNNKRNSKGHKNDRSKNYKGKLADKEEQYVDKSNNKESTYHFRNHPSDFIPDEAIRKQVGSFSFNNTIGIPMRLDSSIEGVHDVVSLNQPSVMSIGLYSSIGALDGVDSIDGINTSGHKYYNILSAGNAKTTQYQPEDISLAIVTIASLLEQVANAIRIYGVAFNFNPRNRDVPNDLISAMGVSPSSLDTNGDLAAYRMRLNRIITVANGIKFIKDLAIFKRSWELASRIFIDENSSMGQYYVFRPTGYWLLTETASTNRATWVDRTNLISAQELLDDIETMVNKLLTSSLFNYIYTDILNYQSKKGGELLTFAYVPELVQVFGVYDPAILNQIHNITWGGANLANYKIIDDVDGNRIVTTNPLTGTSDGAFIGINGSSILDHIYTDQPTYDDNVDAVAFKTAVFNVRTVEGVVTGQGIYLPDHPVQSITIWVNGTPEVFTSSTIGAGGETDASVVAHRLRLFSAFKVAPYLWLRVDNKRTTPIGSFNFFTVIEPKQLENMFEYFYLGLYNVEVSDVKSFQ